MKGRILMFLGHIIRKDEVEHLVLACETDGRSVGADIEADDVTVHRGDE